MNWGLFVSITLCHNKPLVQPGSDGTKSGSGLRLSMLGQDVTSEPILKSGGT